MVLQERIELSTSPLPRECSTTELLQLRFHVLQLSVSAKIQPLEYTPDEYHIKLPGFCHSRV